MRLLTKFWMKTPVGPLVFNRKEKSLWEMCGGPQIVEVDIARLDVNSQEVIGRFGWPMFDNKFAPYGERYEEVLEAVKPVYEAPVTAFFGVRKGNTVYGTARDGSAEIFIKQQEEKSNGKN